MVVANTGTAFFELSQALYRSIYQLLTTNSLKRQELMTPLPSAGPVILQYAGSVVLELSIKLLLLVVGSTDKSLDIEVRQLSVRQLRFIHNPFTRYCTCAVRLCLVECVCNRNIKFYFKEKCNSKDSPSFAQVPIRYQEYPISKKWFKGVAHCLGTFHKNLNQ